MTTEAQPQRAATRALIDAVRGTRTVELGHPHFTGMPCSPNHPGFRMTLIRRHGDMVRPDGGSASNEIIVTGGHGHARRCPLARQPRRPAPRRGRRGRGPARRGSRRWEPSTPPSCSRAASCSTWPPPRTWRPFPGYGVTASDLEASAERAGVQIQPGDVVLVRTGWARHFDNPATYLGQTDGVPGPTVEAAEWLAAKRIRTTGADTTAYEQIRPGSGHSSFPSTASCSSTRASTSSST